jgi:hypothetical protein
MTPSISSQTSIFRGLDQQGTFYLADVRQIGPMRLGQVNKNKIREICGQLAAQTDYSRSPKRSQRVQTIAPEPGAQTRRIDMNLEKLARPERFERPTLRFVVALTGVSICDALVQHVTLSY